MNEDRDEPGTPAPGSTAAEKLLALLRDANERLVLSSVRAHELVEAAQAARVEMAASEERFRSLVEASAAIVWRTAPDGYPKAVAIPPLLCLDAPSRWTALTGMPGEDTPGWNWIDAVHPADQERARAAWLQAMADGQPYHCELRLRTREGAWVWMAARAVRQPTTGEWVGMMTDITDRKALEVARQRFIGILGHDLRNPLSALTLGVSLLSASKTLSERDRGIVERMQYSSGRMKRMVNDLLDFARGQLGGGIPAKLRVCDLGPVCEAAVAEAMLGNPGRAITFTRSGNLEGRWDPDRIEQVVSNLVGNAIQHGEGAVVVSASEVGGDVAIQVTNEGDLIPDALVGELFQPFSSRADPLSNGLGLGLYIVHEIVRAHGGRIDVRSRTEDGTSFTVWLPRREAPPSA